eukprot:TRINITY_DN38203_c0_g1_i1.p1 TRINITY_DN38203_c0_g1~~TRINITY_DN38203_c0_g1_i1.p1  ORF type:complete len:339 (+),score=76.20 TRINITY_DN38203_c0_g1_i1:134-1150(+)
MSVRLASLLHLRQPRWHFPVSVSRALASKAVATRPSHESAVAEKQRQNEAALRRNVESVMRSAESTVHGTVGKVFKGSASGTSYVPDSGVLGDVFKPPSEAVRERPSASPTAAHVAPAPAAPVPMSLGDLEKLPAKELKTMLAMRGVSPPKVTEKSELASWVYQHQDLPAIRSKATVEADKDLRPLSMTELDRMSVAELRKALHERNVDEGTCTEKSDLVKWVFEHQHLPMVPEEQRQKSRTDGKRRFGFRAGGDPHDSSREESKDDMKELPEPDEQKLLDGKEQKLLEGSSAEEETHSRAWPLWAKLCSGFVAVAVLGLGALAANDARRAETDERVE